MASRCAALRRTLSGHDLLQAISFDEQLLVALLASVIVLLLNVDDSTSDSRNTLHDHVGQSTLQLAQSIVLVGTIDVYTQTVLARDDRDRLYADKSDARQGTRWTRTSCLTFNFRAATMAHLMSSKVSSSCGGCVRDIASME